MHNIQQTQEKNINSLSGIPTRNPSKRRASELRLRQHRDRFDYNYSGFRVSRVSLLQSIFFPTGHSKPPKSKIYLHHEYLVGRATEYRMAPIICSTITAFLPCIKNVYRFTYTQQKAPENSEVHRLLQNCGPSVRNLLHVTTLGPINWRRFLNFWKICGP